MHSEIRTVMGSLVETPPDSMPFQVTAMSKRRWAVETEAGPVVQLELLDTPDLALVYATTARDGSGPLRASFITMLLLEDTIANVMHPYGVCSGEATVTIYRPVALVGATPESIAHEMEDFAHLAASLLAKRGIGLPGTIIEDERDVA